MSQFICQTPSCALALSKASFPISMNCPVCQTPLEEKSDIINLSPDDVALINSLPYVIAYPLKRTLLEKHPPQRLNYFRDTFLNYLKYIGLITASEFFNSPLKDKKMVALFQQALAEPSFGSWNQYIRETLSYLKENYHSFFCSDLLIYYDFIESGKKRKLFKGEIEIMDANGDIQIKKQEATAIGMLINFRNRYLGHGLTLDESDAVNHWEMYFPIFRELLVQLKFSEGYPMFKCEHGETFLLKSAEISLVEKGNQTSARVWIEDPEGNSMGILPFFIVPGEVSLAKEDKEQLLTYESYTGKTIKFFSPEGTEKQTSGKILEKLNLLLRDKQKETPFTPEAFTKDEFLKRIAEENRLLLDTLISEKKIIPGIYQHREEMETKLREWIGARASIFFIVAEAGSGKTNLLVEMQRQYTERELPSLFIRAGRMEKQSLKEQIAYLLNIDLQQGLVNYASIAGTQAQPTFILIDGLNEANNAEEIWRDIIDISKVFIPGSIKFVVTNRANTKAELSRYIVSENDFNLLYGENKANAIGLGAFVNWLTPFNMVEMKEAWEDYIRRDKNKFKPLFSFDDLATFDRALYNQISNPLVLRLFLETYQGKKLPENRNQNLNIWNDWLTNFSLEEQTFLELLAEEIYEKGKNELMLDELINHSLFKDYLTTDLVNTPYPRLKNKGWISRYVRDLDAYLSITVEGALFHLLGKLLNSKQPVLEITDLVKTFREGNKLKNTAAEEFLCHRAVEGDISLVIDLIDLGEQYIEYCLKPLIIFVKTFGIKTMIEQILKNPTHNDWNTLLQLDERLSDLELHILKKEILSEAISHNKFQSKDELLFGLKAVSVLEIDAAKSYQELIYKLADNFKSDKLVLEAIGDFEKTIGQLESAIEFYLESISFNSDVLESIRIYHKIGEIYFIKEDSNHAIEIFEKCLEINSLTPENAIDSTMANTFGGLGNAYYLKGDYNKAFDFQVESLNIFKKIHGDMHSEVAVTLSNIALCYFNNGDIDKAIQHTEECLIIQLYCLPPNHKNLSQTYTNLGSFCHMKEDKTKAIDHIQKALEIETKGFGDNHPEMVGTYINFANILLDMDELEKSIEYYEKSLNVAKNSNFNLTHRLYRAAHQGLGVLYKKIGEYEKALNNFGRCLEIEIQSFGTESIEVANTLSWIASTHKSLDNYENALNYYLKCIDIEISTLGSEHLDVGTSHFKIASVYDKLGDYTMAIKHYKASIDIDLIMDLEDFSDVLYSFDKIIDIAEQMSNLGNHSDAIEYYTLSLNYKVALLGKDHYDLSYLYYNLGMEQKAIKDFKSALISLESGVKISPSSSFFFEIGYCYDKLENITLAFDSFLKSAEIRNEEFGIDDFDTQQSIENVIRLAKELTKEDDLPLWIKKSNYEKPNN